jgi:hypothetical protein
MPIVRVRSTAGVGRLVKDCRAASRKRQLATVPTNTTVAAARPSMTTMGAHRLESSFPVGKP